jgi:hypothetical protein
MQTCGKDKDSTTYTPTGRVTAIRTIISNATEDHLTLQHWGISGTFMTKCKDAELHLDLPPGYHLPPGKASNKGKAFPGSTSLRLPCYSTVPGSVVPELLNNLKPVAQMEKSLSSVEVEEIYSSVSQWTLVAYMPLTLML